MIISVSRRTDIVAFYTPWLIERINALKAVYYNPFNYQGYEISLKPDDVDLFAFISKNYQPLIPYLDDLKTKYNLYFHYTITGLSGILEERVPPVKDMIKVFHQLSEKTSPHQVEWRFDPIVLTNITPLEFYRQKFQEIVPQLAGYTQRCYFSFATIYDKVKRSFRKLEDQKGVQLLKIDPNSCRELANELGDLGRQYGIQMYSCCNDLLVNDKVWKAHCIDGEHLSKLFNLNKQFSPYPTREDCGCVKCVDLGVYDTCPHGCSYCYANLNNQIALKNYQTHQKTDELLVKGKIKVVKRLRDEKSDANLES